MVSLEEVFVGIAGTDPLFQALLAGVVIAAMNTAGALGIVVVRDPSERTLDGALGFAAGVMLSASYTSLIIPGIDFASAPGYEALGLGGFELVGIGPVIVGFVLGVVLLDAGDAWVPYVQQVITGREFPPDATADGGSAGSGTDAGDAGTTAGDDTDAGTGSEAETGSDPGAVGDAEVDAGGTDAAGADDGSEGNGTDAGSRPVADAVSDAVPVEADRRVASVVLFIVAITLHNAPEGLAVGVGFGSAALGTGGEATLGNALALMLAIGVQNVPEGLAVSVAARNAGMGTYTYAAIAGVRAGLVEIPLAVFGAVAVGVAAPLLPYAMGFAAGGMLFVISHEIVPQTHSRGNEHVATTGLMVGVLVMLYLDVTLA